MKWRIAIDDSSLDFSRRSVTGKLYWENEQGSCFPSRDWSDFVVIVLGWWCAAVIELVRGSNVATLDFMDGPFVGVIQKNGQEYSIKCKRRSRNVFANELNVKHFVHSLISTSQHVILRCKEHQKEVGDAAELEKALTALMAATGESSYGSQ